MCVCFVVSVLKIYLSSRAEEQRQNCFLFCHFVFILGFQKHTECNVLVFSPQPLRCFVFGVFFPPIREQGFANCKTSVFWVHLGVNVCQWKLFRESGTCRGFCAGAGRPGARCPGCAPSLHQELPAPFCALPNPASLIWYVSEMWHDRQVRKLNVG